MAVAGDVRAQPGDRGFVVYVDDPAGDSAEADAIEVLSPDAYTTAYSRDDLPAELRERGAKTLRSIRILTPGPRTIIPILYRGTTTILIVDRMPEVWKMITFAPLPLRGRALTVDMRDDREALYHHRKVIPADEWREVEEPSDLRDRSGVDWAHLALAAVAGDAASVRSLMAKGGPECCSLAFQALAHAGHRSGLLLVLDQYPKNASRTAMLGSALSHAVETGRTEIAKPLRRASAAGR
jgi:hypothetical protein